MRFHCILLPSLGSCNPRFPTFWIADHDWIRSHIRTSDLCLRHGGSSEESVHIYLYTKCICGCVCNKILTKQSLLNRTKRRDKASFIEMSKAVSNSNWQASFLPRTRNTKKEGRGVQEKTALRKAVQMTHRGIKQVCQWTEASLHWVGNERLDLDCVD